MYKADFINQKIIYIDINQSSDSEPLFNIQDLPSELIREVFSQMDYATKGSFSMSCKNFRQLLPGNQFSSYKFVNSCAKLGYGKLLYWSEDNGAKIDIFEIHLGIKKGFFYPRLAEKKINKNFYKSYKLGETRECYMRVLISHINDCIFTSTEEAIELSKQISKEDLDLFNPRDWYNISLE